MSTTSNIIYRRPLELNPRILGVLPIKRAPDILIFGLISTGAATMEGEAITIGPEAYIPAILVWLGVLVYKVYRDGKRADQAARDRLLVELEETNKVQKRELERRDDRDVAAAAELSDARSQVKLAISILRHHQLDTSALTFDD